MLFLSLSLRHSRLPNYADYMFLKFSTALNLIRSITNDST